MQMSEYEDNSCEPRGKQSSDKKHRTQGAAYHSAASFFVQILRALRITLSRRLRELCPVFFYPSDGLRVREYDRLFFDPAHVRDHAPVIIIVNLFFIHMFVPESSRDGLCGKRPSPYIRLFVSYSRNVIEQVTYYIVSRFDLFLNRNFVFALLHALCTSCVELASFRRIRR